MVTFLLRPSKRRTLPSFGDQERHCLVLDDDQLNRLTTTLVARSACGNMLQHKFSQDLKCHLRPPEGLRPSQFAWRCSNRWAKYSRTVSPASATTRASGAVESMTRP